MLPPRPRALVGASVLASALALLTPKPARAFCGFYVAGADAKLVADATEVVLMREGTKTVLSMQNDYKGPPEKFALVIPVPVVLTKESVKVLPREVFDKVDRLGAPRLVEYWEQDPCPSALGLSGIGEGGGGRGAGIGLGSVGTLGHGSGDLGVRVEAKFAVGEYEVVILSARDAAGLDTWLKQEKYAIPSGAEPFFRPYVASGMKFFVAKVDPAKVRFEGGRATLSPLRFHYDSATFSLPVRLGLINSSGKQDLVVNVLARHQRFEVANYPNATIPTNLDVADATRGRFGEFYAALFDDTLAKTPKAVVTEYAWDAGTCDPCPGPTLDGNDLATLGADVLPSGTTGLRPGFAPGRAQAAPVVRGGAATVTGDLPSEVVERVLRRHSPRFRACYTRGLAQNPKLAGKVTTRLTIDASGAVSKAEDAGSTIADATVRQCIQRGMSVLQFPAPASGRPVSVTYPLVLAPPDPNAPVPSGGGGLGLGGLGGFSAQASTPYVLTRMHLRYDATSLGDDLVFRAAPAIAGGRESRAGGQGPLEQGAQPASVNNFQGRYAIRHPWTGPIQCANPRRGV
ncbi:MAG TPA: DUF2330 domain-containing protein, partial [Polyangiaceae bacterium]|nr:DUF2330 domain-containing protein [Polyangiaceae bacterium]